MGRNDSPSVTVMNSLKKEIRVKVECTRTFTKSEKTKWSIGLKTPDKSLTVNHSESHEYEVFHIVNTKDSFLILKPKESKPFPLHTRENYGFLTIWIKDDKATEDGKSWIVYCEDHPIIKGSIIAIESSNNIMRLPIKLPCGEGYKFDETMGGVGVHNMSSKKIWVRIDTDDIREINRTTDLSVELSIATASVPISYNYAAEDKVYYKVQQGLGFTPIEIKKLTNFFLNISTGYIYVSIDYELSGKVTQYGVSYKIPYWGKGDKEYPIISIMDNGEGITHKVNRSTEFSGKGFI
ncbi:hypothetical protein FO519_007703 [Halicephalobus sp. NKZ332]|nr:hypothetical protein FO519_007703 [Halicephalobus sp. NKZ332]